MRLKRVNGRAILQETERVALMLSTNDALHAVSLFGRCAWQHNLLACVPGPVSRIRNSVGGPLCLQRWATKPHSFFFLSYGPWSILFLLVIHLFANQAQRRGAVTSRQAHLRITKIVRIRFLDAPNATVEKSFAFVSWFARKASKGLCIPTDENVSQKYRRRFTIVGQVGVVVF